MGTGQSHRIPPLRGSYEILCRPYGTRKISPMHPALKRWANEFCPYGARPTTNRSRSFPRQVGFFDDKSVSVFSTTVGFFDDKSVFSTTSRPFALRLASRRSLMKRQVCAMSPRRCCWSHKSPGFGCRFRAESRNYSPAPATSSAVSPVLSRTKNSRLSATPTTVPSTMPLSCVWPIFSDTPEIPTTNTIADRRRFRLFE
jgi:hypothetical protein